VSIVLAPTHLAQVATFSLVSIIGDDKAGTFDYVMHTASTWNGASARVRWTHPTA